MSTGELHDEDGDDRDEKRTVESLEVGEHAQAAAIEPREYQRRRRNGRDQNDRLRTREEGEQAEREQDELALNGRSFECEDERKRDTGEERIEDRLRHQRSRVHQRRHRDR